MVEQRDRSPQNNLTRRDFLKLGAVAAATGFVAGLEVEKGLFDIYSQVVNTAKLARFVGNALAYVPEGGLERQYISYPKAGFLESAHPDRPGFLYKDGGHAKYIRYFAQNDRLVGDVLHKAFGERTKKDSAKYTKVGEILEKHMEYAEGTLRKAFPRRGNPSPDNILHLAIMTAAIVNSPYLTIGEAKKIKNLDGKELGDSITQGHQEVVDSNNVLFLFRETMPKVYPGPSNICVPAVSDQSRCVGYNRSVHVFQHLFLVDQYLYSRKNKLGDDKRMPLSIEGLLLFVSKDEDKARLLSFLGGRVWEIDETLNDADNLWKKGEGLVREAINARRFNREEFLRRLFADFEPTGFEDPMSANDLAANHVGREAAISIPRNRKLNKDDIRKLINRLNNSSIYKMLDPQRTDLLIDKYLRERRGASRELAISKRGEEVIYSRLPLAV